MVKNNNILIYSGVTQEEIKNDLQSLFEFQDKGISLELLREMINENLVPHFVNYDHPGFQSLYNFFPEEGAKLGAEIALAYNQGVTNWIVSPGAVMVEELCCGALCHLFDLSPDADATFMYCGTYSNQSALYMALHWTAEQQGFNLAEKGLQGFVDPSQLVVVTSRESHLSLKHALRIMGLGDKSLVSVPVDKNRHIDVDVMLDRLISLKETKNVFCVVLTAGTTSTGSVDPILRIAKKCEELGIWLHVDAAYGLSFFLVPEYRHLFEGIELADSITWDPHKNFGVPIPNSLLFVREGKNFRRMSIYGEYFNRESDLEPNPGLKSPPTTRPLTALPVVTTIRHLGMSKLTERLRSPLTAIKEAYNKLKNDHEIDLCHEPDLSLLCYRITPENVPTDKLNELQQYIYERVKGERKRSISMTKLDDKIVLRIVAINLNVTSQAIMESISYMKMLASEYLIKD
ncbi:MAG: pyridoxal phosphate-dependent decarboxylase family protein [Candidatus Hodarchaeales archaeon]|jgi:L-2,4-diaminobutyrate decarboxylase